VADGELVLCEVADGVATVTLNRPEKLNALSGPLEEQLDAILARLERDDEVRSVVITGAGRAFSAGADLGGPGGSRGPKARWDMFEAHMERQYRVWSLNKPVIAAVHGYCLGRGCELALWCDLVIASEDARIGEPEIRDGSYVASIIPWLIGMQQAKLFMLSGDMLSGREAERIGLVAKCVPEGQALAESLKLARKIAHLPVPTVRALKRMVNAVYEAQGLRTVQGASTLMSTVLMGLTPEERGTAWLEDIRREHGLRAYLEARDAPFKE
jgi:enoyl-CoA hydratase/carnithine racemase